MSKRLEENDIVYFSTCNKCEYNKALEIIKNKQVSVPTFIRSKDHKQYNEWINWQEYDLDRNLTKQEWDLLKGVLL